AGRARPGRQAGDPGDRVRRLGGTKDVRRGGEGDRAGRRGGPPADLGRAEGRREGREVVPRGVAGRELLLLLVSAPRRLAHGPGGVRAEHPRRRAPGPGEVGLLVLPGVEEGRDPVAARPPPAAAGPGTGDRGEREAEP